MATIDNNSKLIFTKEGKRLLVSQTGGIKFALLGFMLVEGLANNGTDPSAPCGEDEDAFIQRWEGIEAAAEEENLSTFEYLTTKTSITFLLKNVQYDYVSEGYVKPTNQSEYNNAVANYKKNLYRTFYIPSTELMTDKDGNHYGTYSFTFDRTDINCDIPKDKGYQVRHLLLIGKQYAENNEAVFNVAHRQDASIVAVAEIRQKNDNGIQILANQNDYVTFQCQLRFTITDSEYNDQTYIIADSDDYEPVDDIASKLALVNNGVKTLSGGVTIGQNKEILDELQLGPDGAICMTKTLTVADCIDADDAENQFNAAALIHSINKYPTDGGEYVPQVLMTTVRSTQSLTEDITAYSVGMTVKAEGIGAPYYLAGATTSGLDAPVFKLGHVPENDYIAVDIFGCDNKQNGNSYDRMLFSTSNSASVPGNGDPNVFINSEGNKVINGAAANGNALYNSNGNVLTEGAADSTLFDSYYNELHGGSNNIINCCDANTIQKGKDNVLIISDNNTVKGNTNVLVDSNVNKIGELASDYSLYASNDNILSGNSYSNVLIKTNNTTLSGTTTDCLFLGANRVKSINDTKAEVILNSKDTVFDGAYEDTLVNSRGSKMTKSYFNGYYDNMYCETVSSDQNTVTRSRFVGVKGLPIGFIDAGERPILSDVQSNNNIVMGGQYFDMYSCSNNIIMDSYKLQSSDSQTSLGPVRVKGSTIVNSGKSKLYNTREVHVLNSDCTRAVAVSNFTDRELRLPGTSNTMASTNELDSIYYGEYYNGKDSYAYYGLKGTSYKAGASSLSDRCRPADLLKLKMMFINSFGSEINLADYNPNLKVNAYQAYSPYNSFDKQNKTLMPTTVSPHNSNILGGHHNKVIGGENTVVLGGEYCKASTYAHQILMGKFNKDVPADIVFGCGHFEGTTYVQGNKEYTESELAEIETLSGTIDGIRGIGENKCFNALEFYAHQGKMVLRNCDDGHDAGTGVINQWFGNSVAISPAGVTWYDNDGNMIGEIAADSNKTNESWTFIIELDDNGDYYVRDTIGVPSEISSLNRNLLASYIFKYHDMNTTTNISDIILESGEIQEANQIIFAKRIPAEFNVVVLDRKPNTDPTSRYSRKWTYINKIMPWYTNEGNAPKYLANGNMHLNYYYAGAGDTTGTYSEFEVRLVKLLNASYICLDDEIRVSEWYEDNGKNKVFNLGSKGSIQFAEFNSNIVYTEWIPNFIDVTEYVSYSYLHNASWTGVSATVYSANYAYSAMHCPCSGTSGYNGPSAVSAISAISAEYAKYAGYADVSYSALHTVANSLQNQLESYYYSQI